MADVRLGSGVADIEVRVLVVLNAGEGCREVPFGKDDGETWLFMFNDSGLIGILKECSVPSME